MSFLQTIAQGILSTPRFIGNVAKDLLTKEISYQAPTVEAAPVPVYSFPEKVTPELQDAFQRTSKHTNMPVETLVNLTSAEHGGTWDPTTKGIADPLDYGLTQLNPSAIAIITGKKKGTRNYFKDNFGEDFDINNPVHQILGMGVYHNYNRQFALPEAGITNPTDRDVIMSYNLGARGYAETVSGKRPDKRFKRYEDYMIKNNVIK
jgi:hypothetical protein